MKSGSRVERQPALPRFVTASLHVDYLQPTPLATPLTLSARVKEMSGRKVVVKVDLTAAGELRARGEVVTVRVPEKWRPPA